MSYRLAVFDMAGTTVSNTDLVAVLLVETLAAHGFAAPLEDARALMGYPKPEAIRRLLGAAANEALVQELHVDFVARMIAAYRDSAEVTPMPGAVACFAALRARGIRVALNTAFTRNVAQVVVDRFNWQKDGLIDDLIATDEVPGGRPQPDMIRTLMARNGVSDPAEVIKIGDTEVDIREGRNAGAGLVVGVTTGAYSRAALQAHQPDHVIDSLLELAPLL
jgi:phosphonatase-like hydrolase